MPIYMLACYEYLGKWKYKNDKSNQITGTSPIAQRCDWTTGASVSTLLRRRCYTLYKTAHSQRHPPNQTQNESLYFKMTLATPGKPCWSSFAQQLDAEKAAFAHFRRATATSAYVDIALAPLASIKKMLLSTLHRSRATLFFDVQRLGIGGISVAHFHACSQLCDVMSCVIIWWSLQSKNLTSESSQCNISRANKNCGKGTRNRNHCVLTYLVPDASRIGHLTFL